ncbi:UDP-N-acetylmuramoyl-tripeptide--D-alanyl-D-alanine ligase [Companilactobacillus sp.]|jgi:UDP-N-acetylmuramoyl-tripeptide--D-alanyl-D-alanine ligase|uniref:UDP-N-acetylmuramoyl-tripeptide--D-alanyl-D- alanine ligase n=1 Tax=Companilactobacillus sp. TaxID=2767905 RepID=UPI0025C31A91|nr:UDP-N-acetylmuramoyl-tripeptide--D-alanyl-D-alanine ligase [Companilactobacillus sp.]MCH4010127.1 UDP-N-acetylmuramoyl-tripeptide--D-alanyl-D-alanine ligase [Companilactobacillus sp.]MCH4052197.1 UDP-N-acetylmuramoyl-tripeptide--D-alanyl-D-alanine ligase [Companilactobacillus sp.]MCH4078069.1 UDP-N-acetylmuramoyl-tripeptide--D-alanyl-D-alanine ligase [Companilactobacillus sp.]MCH4126645.1 UDP-N-acetylmuramoyl-tripeptide--D-alanyl-D-alanine ligase [Companilactobacillus sp.]MCH4132230.1 UDP-N
MKMKLQEVYSALKIKADNVPDVQITGVCFDSRKAKTGDLFFPLQGERDGHEFIESAINNGASASVWQKDHPITNKDIPYVIVDDVMDAFNTLAKYYLNKVNPKVVAVTGSNGKTTTKDMIASVLGTDNNVAKTPQNFNNEIGVPFTILNMPINTEVLVVEMGMDRPGQIEHLSELAHPDVSVITMIGEAHIEFFGTRDKIADAKMEITHHLQEDGLFVFDGDEPLLTERAKDVQRNQATFGQNDSNTIYSTEINSDKEKTTFKTNLWPDIEFSIPIMGDYNVNNALAALLVGRRYHIKVEAMQKALADFYATANRTEWLKAQDGADILSDVYNSNPTAAIEVLDNLKKLSTGRKIVVLGDMLELGDASKKLHESLADHIDPNDFAKVYLVGNEMKALYDLLVNKYDPADLSWYGKDQLAELTENIKEEMNSDDTILLKASHGIHLENVLKQLI